MNILNQSKYPIYIDKTCWKTTQPNSFKEVTVSALYITLWVSFSWRLQSFLVITTFRQRPPGLVSYWSLEVKGKEHRKLPIKCTVKGKKPPFSWKFSDNNSILIHFPPTVLKKTFLLTNATISFHYFPVQSFWEVRVSIRRAGLHLLRIEMGDVPFFQMIWEMLNSVLLFSCH